MTVLHTLALVLGVVAVAKSLTAALWPKGYREHSMRLIESDLLLRGVAVFALLIGLIIVVAIFKARPWLEIALLALAVIYLPMGVMMLWRPDLYRRLSNKILLTSDLTLRLWCALGLIIGFVLFFLGVFG